MPLRGQQHHSLRQYYWLLCFDRGRAVITKGAPDHALMMGNPVHQIGWVCSCGVKLALDAKGYGNCAVCDEMYINKVAIS